MFIELNDEEKKELFIKFNLKHIEFCCNKLKIKFKNKLIKNKRSKSGMIPILYVIPNKNKNFNK